MIAEQVLSAQVEVFMTSITAANQLPAHRLGDGPRTTGSASRCATSRRSRRSRGRARSAAPPSSSATRNRRSASRSPRSSASSARSSSSVPAGPRAISMTEAGELLLRHAEAIVNRLDAARADMASLRAGETGDVARRDVPVDQCARPPRRDAPVHERLARHRVRALGAVERRHALPRIESGDIDLGFCSLPVPDGPFDAIELLSDPHVLLVSADSPLAARDSSVSSPTSATCR